VEPRPRLTSVWEDEDAFPKTPAKDNPNVIDVEVSRPKRPSSSCATSCRRRSSGPFTATRSGKVPAVLARDLRELQSRGLRRAAQLGVDGRRSGAENKPPATNVERIWVWTHGSLDLVSP